MSTKSKKIMKIAAVILVIMTLFAVAQPVFATDSLIDPTKTLTPTYGSMGGVETKAQKIIGLIRNIAVIAGVIMLMIIGVKYILGSAEEKADYKKSMIPLIVGIVVVMAASQIVAMVVNFAN